MSYANLDLNTRKELNVDFQKHFFKRNLLLHKEKKGVAFHFHFCLRQ